jgi:hypothetical protein
MPGGLIGLVIALVIIGVCLELLKTKVPIDDTIRVLINLVIVIAVVLYILDIFGIVTIPVRR